MKEETLKEKSRNYSIKDGIFATIKDSVSGNFISPFAIAINSSNSMIAMLSSIPGLLGPISQWQSSELIENHTRKKIISTAVLFEIICWIPLITIAVLYYFNIIQSFLPLLLLAFYSLYIICANAGAPAWFSWIGDLIDDKHRGRWFAKRTFILSIVSLISSIVAALILDYLKKTEFIIFGFAVLFLIAMISRSISRYYIKKQYEPKIVIEKESYFSFYNFIKKAPFNNFGRFAIFRSLLNGATAIASPFFTIYMLRDLHFSYITWIVVISSATFFQLILIKYWGKFSDKYGNYEVLKITIIFIIICPIAWIISKSPIYLIFIPQLLSGIGWGGFNLACSNYIFDCVTPQKRSLAYSYSELLNGIGIFCGSAIGAFLIENIHTSLINPILIIFVISGIARLIVGITMIPTIREVKVKKKFRTIKEFENLKTKIEEPIKKELLYLYTLINPKFFINSKQN